MKIILNKISNTWKDVLNAARNTVNKKELNKNLQRHLKQKY